MKTIKNGVLTIKIPSKFYFGMYQEFREAYEAQDRMSVVVDLEDTHYVDSSALGMLLLLRDYMDGDNADITLANTTPEIKDILVKSNFDHLFKITEK